LLPAAIDDRVLEQLDRDGGLRDAEHARALAGRGANTAGELREIIRLQQPLERLAPEAAIDQIVPLGNQVVNRAPRCTAVEQLPRLAERHAAVHAARGLVPQPPLLHVVMELVPVAHALERRAVDRQLPQIFDESGWLTHL